jgi:hypothetical protein
MTTTLLDLQPLKLITPVVDRSVRPFRREYDAQFDGEYIGTFPTYHAAEDALDAHVYELLDRGLIGPAELSAEPEEGDGSAARPDHGPVPAGDDCPKCSVVPSVVPNEGVHVTQYTVVLSLPGQTFNYILRDLCDTCAARMPHKSKMGEVINGHCDGCGVGPSVSHFRFAA